MTTFGKKTHKSADWVETHAVEMTPVFEKRNALAMNKANSSEDPEDLGRQQQNPCWLRLCSQIQIADVTGTIRVIYDEIKMALGPTQKKTASLKSSKIMAADGTPASALL